MAVERGASQRTATGRLPHRSSLQSGRYHFLRPDPIGLVRAAAGATLSPVGNEVLLVFGVPGGSPHARAGYVVMFAVMTAALPVKPLVRRWGAWAGPGAAPSRRRAAEDVTGPRSRRTDRYPNARMNEAVMQPSRRHFLTATAWAAPAAALFAATAARADDPQAQPSDIGVYCEPTLAPVLRELGARFRIKQGVRVAVLCAPARVVLEQVRRNPGEDLLIVPDAAMTEAIRAGFIAPGSARDLARNPLVFAERAPGGRVQDGGVQGSGGIAGLFAGGVVAVTDPSPAATFDGHAALTALGLSGLDPSKVVGVADTGDGAFMVRTGAARAALVYLSDVRADPALSVAAVADPALLPPILYRAALNPADDNHAAAAFLDFLAGPSARRVLAAAGLEPAP